MCVERMDFNAAFVQGGKMVLNSQIKVTHSCQNGENCLFFERHGHKISPWHDIPLFADEESQVLNMVVEIPRQSKAKMEISKEDSYNPIKQDFVNGQPRELADIPPFHGYPCNYGALPQTWEDPDAIDAHTGIAGDDDPLDVCEIGSELASCGQIKKVKLLGAFVILDEGQTDWKIVAVDIGDSLENKLSDIGDVEKYLPGFLDSLKDWYCRYKVPDGKGENKVGLEGKVMDRGFALGLINHCHLAWRSRKGYSDA